MCREFYSQYLLTHPYNKVLLQRRAFLFYMQYQYYTVYKPYMVLSQFSSEDGKPSLKDFFQVKNNVYPVGRLDYDSEGLLILTNDPALNHRLLHPSFNHSKEYLVQVDGEVTASAVALLSAGVSISINGKKHHTQPAMVKVLPEPPNVPERNPPIRVRKNIPTSWISITLTEGKNRQVRKMTAATGFPTLRLIRNRIQGIFLNNMQPGDIVEWSQTSMYHKLFGK